MADFTPTDLITLSKALEHYERHAEPSQLPPQRELMQTRATLLHQMNVASMAICERLSGGQEFPPAKDGLKPLYQLLTELEQSGDLLLELEDDDQGLAFCTGFVPTEDAIQIIANWYLNNREVAHEVISEALHGKEANLAAFSRESNEELGDFVWGHISEKAFEYAQADPAWEKLIQDITERERS